MKKQIILLVRFFALLGLVSLACGINFNTNDTTPAPAPAVTVIVQPTQPPPPTMIPPTPVPPTAAPIQLTKAQASPAPSVPPEFQEKVDYYYEKAYLPSTKGEYIPLDDFSKDWAMINSDYVEDTGYRVDDFMVTAHFEWQSAIQHSDPAGCGWAFHKSGNDYYVFFVDKEYIWFASWDYSAQNFIRFGMTSGSQYVGLGNPADADVALIVNDMKAYVLIDDTYKGSYTLDTDFLTGKGDLAYEVVSGTNSDYGTRCRMTDVVLWSMDD